MKNGDFLSPSHAWIKIYIIRFQLMCRCNLRIYLLFISNTNYVFMHTEFRYKVFSIFPFSFYCYVFYHLELFQVYYH